MSDQNEQFKKLVSHCKEYAFIFQSSEVYDGLSAVYDYGPNGVLLKRNLKDYWWKSMVQMHENIVGLDSAIFMHPKVWKASGHVDVFNDPLIDNKDSNKRYRADVLVEEYLLKVEGKANKEVKKAAKRFGESFDEEMYRSTNPRVVGYLEKHAAISERLGNYMRDEAWSDLKGLIEELEIACPVSGSKNWDKLYLRPETAQGIFVNFLNIQKSTRQKLPFGVAQIGKAFRNEIIARQFIFRMREFEQMEMQFFVPPGEELKYYEYWKQERWKWHMSLGTPEENIRFHDHDNLAHYANAAVDIQFKFPFGFRELEGIHSRTDFDLKSHQEESGRKLQYFDPEKQENYIPYVVETSIGLDRLFLAVMSQALQEETVPDAKGNESTRVVLKINPKLAPVQVAVLPLVKNKEALTTKARNVFNDLKSKFVCQYDEKDAIGRRYRRQDAIGTPYCITVDFESLDDESVTIRDRDSLNQRRVKLNELDQILNQQIG